MYPVEYLPTAVVTGTSVWSIIDGYGSNSTEAYGNAADAADAEPLGLPSGERIPSLVLTGSGFAPIETLRCAFTVDDPSLVPPAAVPYAVTRATWVSSTKCVCETPAVPLLPALSSGSLGPSPEFGVPVQISVSNNLGVDLSATSAASQTRFAVVRAPNVTSVWPTRGSIGTVINVTALASSLMGPTVCCHFGTRSRTAVTASVRVRCRPRSDEGTCFCLRAGGTTLSRASGSPLRWPRPHSHHKHR